MSLKEQRDKLRKRRDSIDKIQADLEGESRRLKQKIEAKRERDPKDDERAMRLADERESLRAERQHIDVRLDELDARDGKLLAKIKVLGRKIREAREKKGEYASEHFRYDEFNCKQGGPVPEYMYPHLRDLCERILEPMRAEFGGCFVTSGHRWSWYDAAIGGVGGYHVYEKYKSQPASDLIFDRGTPAQWAAFARDLGIGGVGQYDRSGFVHVDTGPRRDWWG
jgi:hypothetical protein